MKNIIELDEAETADVLRQHFAKAKNVNPAVVQVRLDVGMVTSGYGAGESQRPGFTKAVVTLPDTTLESL